MNSREISRILPVAAAVAVAATLLGGAGLSILAQTTEDSPQDLSGTINSLVQEGGEATYIIGGEWQLSADSDEVSDFSADLVMTKTDGTGAHTHRIVMADEGVDSLELEDEPSGDIQVTLTPDEQNVGGSVLVNATGISGNGTTTVKVGDIIAGNPESDADGNLLFALGISEEMVGSQTVTVEAGGSSGSAPLTALVLENTTDVELGNTAATEGNLTTTDNTGNLTESTGETTESTGNLTESTGDMTEGSTESTTPEVPSTDTTDDSIYGTTIEGDIYGTESGDTGSSDLTATDETDDSTDMNPDGDLTTFEEEAIAAGEVFEDMADLDNATSTTTNATDDSSVPGDSEAGITMSFEVVADIYTDDELKWEDVNITVSVMNGEVISLEIDPVATENHFGDQPIFGIADTD